MDDFIVNLIEKIIALNDEPLLEFSKTITTQAKLANDKNGKNLEKLAKMIGSFKEKLLESDLISNQELADISDSDIYEKLILGVYLKMVKIAS